ncbi:DUF3102 domain-containing protein [Paraburkholderia aspalathi]|nr:DUF3102 domain-containing protein [Paraburkholderia aspalathi]
MTNRAPLTDFVFETAELPAPENVNSMPSNTTPSNNQNIVPFISPSAGFDYSGVSIEIADEAEATAERIRDRHRDGIIATGNDLLSIKDKLAHGKFGSWLDYHFNMSERSAQNYMNTAQVFGSAPKVIDVLPATTVYKLAAKGVPTLVRQSVIDEVLSGISLDAKDIEKRIITAKEEERTKREDVRQKQNEIRAWSKHELAMKKAGKTPEEIDAERKLWETKKARAERQKEKKLAVAKKAEEQSASDLLAQQDRKEQMEKLALKAAMVLKNTLAEKFDNFRDAILKIDFSNFQKALQNT